ncbi:sulfatase-like hydrolase/transferase [Propionivibrio limicola]|uniref:sulfatase-like hydrolase/transferase n=1 Tax=Propionivibrio limicola TaxID=167645 RepID=UPI001FEC8221|nr:sulfatase-like hydrolase/transferase [Propionivibrio limicola]
MPGMLSFSPLTRINRFFVLSWLLVAVHLTTLAGLSQYADWRTGLWSLATTSTYSLFYLLPALCIVFTTRKLAGWLLAPRGAAAVIAAAAIGSTGLTHVLLFADRVIHSMYGFHINGFVVDLVLTPGGIASLGASLSTQLTATAIVLALFALQAAAYFWLAPRFETMRKRLWRVQWRWLLIAVAGLSLGERVAYAYSSAANYRPILFASERYPFYLPTSARTLAKKLGIEEISSDASGIAVKNGTLHYPLAPLDIEPPARPPNVVWLVAESLRFDMLDPKIMPKTWTFSQDALRLEQHYSGGNVTQMGVFSMFYGLYSTYWFPMLDNRRSPVLLDVMKKENYQFGLYTSQRFTYPAFDKTIFVNMNKADLHERSEGAIAWQRDRANVADLLDFIDRRDPTRPFMTYMFFESTHANYNFPDETAIARPYLDDLNYLTADFAADIGQIKNRYINAAHHVDQQIGRVIDHLRAKKLLDNTIIIVLGDHGEEFMERSHWGHAAEFNRFQTSTPAMIRIPGEKPRVVTGITSHLDIPATLLPLLGVKNPPSDYSLGYNLLAPDYHRDYAVAGDWNRIAYIGNDLKISFPVNASGTARNKATDGDDNPIDNVAEAKASIRPAMLEMMQNLARFSGRNG